MRTVYWEDNRLKMIDQRLLPTTLEIVAYRTHREVAQAIKDMVVRGAPAIGAAAGFGLALAREAASASTSELLTGLQNAAALLRTARPTAVNLAWALDRILKKVSELHRRSRSVASDGFG